MFSHRADRQVPAYRIPPRQTIRQSLAQMVGAESSHRLPAEKHPVRVDVEPVVALPDDRIDIGICFRQIPTGAALVVPRRGRCDDNELRIGEMPSQPVAVSILGRIRDHRARVFAFRSGSTTVHEDQQAERLVHRVSIRHEEIDQVIGIGVPQFCSRKVLVQMRSGRIPVRSRLGFLKPIDDRLDRSGMAPDLFAELFLLVAGRRQIARRERLDVGVGSRPGHDQLHKRSDDNPLAHIEMIVSHVAEDAKSSDRQFNPQPVCGTRIQNCFAGALRTESDPCRLAGNLLSA